MNTTSVGLREDASPVDAGALRAGAVVMDAVYDPERTRLLREAEARGARAVSGRWMLIHQAAEQVRLLTGREAPLSALIEGFESALRASSSSPTSPCSLRSARGSASASR